MKEQQSFPFSHVLFPAPEVLEWDPCPCRQENSRQCPGPRLLRDEKEGLEVPVGHSHGGCVVVDSEQGAGARASQPVAAAGAVQLSETQRGRLSPGAGVGEGVCFALRGH